MNTYAMVINGRSINTVDQDPVINPAFGERFATCARGTSAHVEEAMQAAAAAFVDEEQFGTALPVIKYRRLDDVLEQANRTHYGLGGSIWTSDPQRGMALVREIESGTGWVNHHLDITPFAPFGGAKWSGIGHENGRWGYNEFTEMQVINAKK